MAQTKTFAHSFAGGEIAPEMLGRIDSAQYQAGAARLRNFVVRPNGTIVRRPGTRYCSSSKDSSNVVRLFPFTYSTTETRVLEFGRATVDARSIGYIRFHTNGTLVTYTAGSEYIVPQSVSTTTAGSYTNGVDYANNSFLMAAAHGLTTGNPIVFTLSGAGALPTSSPQLVAGTTYYAIVVDTDEIQVAETLAQALSGDEVNLLSGGAGGVDERRVHYNYTPGDLVKYTAVSSSTFYCMSAPHTNHTGYAPVGGNTDHWYREPSDMTYEVPHGFASADLFDVHYVQSNDVMTFAHPNYPASELRRYSDTRWVTAVITFAASVAAPTTVSVAATRGETMRINSIVAGSPATLDFFNNHAFIDNDIVYVYDETAVPSLPDGFYSAIFTPPPLGTDPRNRIALKSATTGQDHNAGGTAIGTATGSVQRASLNDDITNYYVVTCVDSNDVESTQSSAASVANNLYTNGSYNTISWSAVSGAQRYRVYKKKSGLYGYIGEADSSATSFVDDKIAPDLGISPPVADSSMGNPRAVAYFEGRRCFGGTTAAQQTVWMTRSNTESDLSFTIPIKDSDRIKFTLANLQAATIRHLVPLAHLLILTSGSEYRVTSLDGNALTPSNVTPRPQSYVGASNAQPVVVNNSVLFCAARGGHVREMGFSNDAQGFVTGDLSLRASHLFDGLQIVEMAAAKAPFPLVWLVSSDGSLLSLTYVPEERIGAWCRHEFDGTVESAAVIAEGDEDRVYLVVRRTVNGSTVRMIERMGTFDYGDADDAYFVDAGATKTPSGTTVSGLTHLVGETVAVLVDGEVQTTKVVGASGTITLDETGTVAQVGLPVVATLRTLPIVLQTAGYGMGRPKAINKAWLRWTDDSGDFDVAQVDGAGAVGDYAPSKSIEEGGIVLPTGWSPDGSIEVMVDDPVPLSIISMTTEVSIGG